MEEASRFSTRFKYVESTGTSLIGRLGTLDPWDTPCNREKCFPCMSEKGRCMQQGCNYIITCMICKEQGNQVQYFGESARTPYDRGLEHLAALKAENIESPLWEHHTEDHNTEEPQFEMKVSGYKLKPLERQAEEAAKLDEFTGLKFLNRRGEWGQNLPPKLALEENLSKSQGGKRKPQENKKKC